MARERERQAAAAAANSPDRAETPGQTATGGPPHLERGFESTRSSDSGAAERESGQNVPGLPDDLGVSGGYVHGDHSFVSQSVIDRETGSPVQKTVCAVCGAEVVGA